MSRRVKFVIISVSFFGMISCHNQRDETLKLYQNYSIDIVKENYPIVYKKGVDSLDRWVKNNLKTYIGNDPWKIDSLVCFNRSGDKCVMAIAIQCLNNCVQDDLSLFYGVKINEEWFFFLGAGIVLPREYYQKDIHIPLSFEKMHEIAMKEIFSGYLIKNAEGNWQVNDHFFDRIPNSNGKFGGFGPCYKCKTEDEYYMYLVRSNWLLKHVPFTKEEITLYYDAQKEELKLHFPLRPYADYIAPFKVVAKMTKAGSTAEPVVSYIQSKMNFEESDLQGEVKFEGVKIEDELSINIQVYYTGSSENPRPVNLVIPINKIRNHLISARL